MIVGFASLAKLKLNCLPESLRSRTTWDSTLTQIGLAVAAAIANVCNRDFERSTTAAYKRPADCSACSVPCYPLESVTTAVVRREGSSTDENISDQIANIFQDSGVIEFTSILGTYKDRLTLTYVGGYWWDDTAEQTGTLPTGATALPADIEQAWMLQCQALIERTRILKMGAMETNKEGEYVPGISKVELLPGVLALVNAYTRYA